MNKILILRDVNYISLRLFREIHRNVQFLQAINLKFRIVYALHVHYHSMSLVAESYYY